MVAGTSTPILVRIFGQKSVCAFQTANQQLTIKKTARRMQIEHLFEFVFTEGVMSMSEIESKMLAMIRENENPAEAVLTAIAVFSAFLEQLQEAAALQADDQLESA